MPRNFQLKNLVRYLVEAHGEMQAFANLISDENNKAVVQQFESILISMQKSVKQINDTIQ